LITIPRTRQLEWLSNPSLQLAQTSSTILPLLVLSRNFTDNVENIVQQSDRTFKRICTSQKMCTTISSIDSTTETSDKGKLSIMPYFPPVPWPHQQVLLMALGLHKETQTPRNWEFRAHPSAAVPHMPQPMAHE
jgi:hypothetical protein